VSQYFELGDVTLWNPSSRTSRLFLGQVALFEQELGLTSGIGAMESDESQVVPGVLERFVEALLMYRARTNHAVAQALSDGFVATVLVLAERAGIQVRCERWSLGVAGPRDGGAP
jgi:hypothetical protein